MIIHPCACQGRLKCGPRPIQMPSFNQMQPSSFPLSACHFLLQIKLQWFINTHTARPRLLCGETGRVAPEALPGNPLPSPSRPAPHLLTVITPKSKPPHSHHLLNQVLHPRIRSLSGNVHNMFTWILYFIHSATQRGRPSCFAYTMGVGGGFWSKVFYGVLRTLTERGVLGPQRDINLSS